ncbi:MAG: ribonuclease P protein component 4 [Candidatus Aenigmatarchaeota archaeon]
MGIRTKKPEWQRKIAWERIRILFNLAEKELEKHPERSKRYVELARKIGLRYNIRLPRNLKRKFCKKCNTLLKPGTTCTVRIVGKVLTIKCKNCNNLIRYRVCK